MLKQSSANYSRDTFISSSFDFLKMNPLSSPKVLVIMFIKITKDSYTARFRVLSKTIACCKRSKNYSLNLLK